MDLAIQPLNKLIKKYGTVEYIRDYYAAINGRLKMLYSKDEFYIAEDLTYQPWLSINGVIPNDMSDNFLIDMLTDYINNSKYIAVYTNIERIAEFFLKLSIF